MNQLFQFKDKFVAVKEYNSDVVKTKKMSYVDFYKMLRQLEENESNLPTIDNHSTSLLEIKHEWFEKYKTLFNFTGRDSLPNNLRQYKVIDQTRLVLLLEIGSKASYAVDRKYDEELEYVNLECDFGSEYLIEFEIGFNTSTQPKPNGLTFNHVYRRNMVYVDSKPKMVMEEIPYLLEKLKDFTEREVTSSRSKIMVVRNVLYGNSETTVENILRLLTQKDLLNTNLMKRVEESIAKNTKINWEGVEY